MKSYHFKTVTDNDIIGWVKEDKIYTLSEYNQTKLPKENFQSRYLDCHGLVVNECYNRVMEFIESHYRLGTKKLTIVTGRSGRIKKEFEDWMRNNKFVRYFKLKQNKGSWEVYLRT